MNDRFAGRVVVRRVGADDWQTWRDLRLAALQDSPGAFASTYEAERARTALEWRQGLARVDGLRAVAEVGEVPAGIVGGYLAQPDVVDLVSLWVVPAARGVGVGDALVTEVLRWARGQSVDDIRLWVARGNLAAERLYVRHGFERTGDVQPLPSDPCRDEIRMRLHR